MILSGNYLYEWFYYLKNYLIACYAFRRVLAVWDCSASPKRILDPSTKPENLIDSDLQARVCDFDMAQMHGESRFGTAP